MKFKEAMILSKIGVKVRCTGWYEEGSLVNIHEDSSKSTYHSQYWGTDELGGLYNIVKKDLKEDWEYFNEV